MIHTGEWPLSAQASEALQSAATRAVARRSGFVTCEDLLCALVSIRDSEAAQVRSVLNQPTVYPASHQTTGAVECTPPNVSPEVMATVRASKPLQEAIELSSNGVGITTGSLLIGLFRVRRSEVSGDLAFKGVTEDRLWELLASCEPEKVLAR